jgi:hypothetical protein
MSAHAKLLELFEEYLTESEKFEEKGNKSAATRARKALMEITKECKARRAEIQNSKNEG